MDDSFKKIIEKGQKSRAQNLLRILFSPFSHLENHFASYDFLALSKHPLTRERGIEYALSFGSDFSHRFYDPYLKALHKVQDQFSSLTGKETTFFVEPKMFSFEALFSSHTLIFKDKHLSIPGLDHRFFPFDPSFPLELKTLLERTPLSSNESRVIVIESISSVTGIFADLDSIIQMAKESSSLLIVKDTLSLGVLGENGFGLASQKPGIDLIYGELHHPFNAYLSYVSTSHTLSHWFFDKKPELFSSRMIHPILLGMLSAFIELIPSMHAERKRLEAMKQLFLSALKRKNLFSSPAFSPLIVLPLSHPYAESEIRSLLQDQFYLPPKLIVDKKTPSLSFLISLYLTPLSIKNITEIISEPTLVEELESL